MTRRWPFLSASVVLLVVTLSAPPARALDEPERLRLVGERAFADGLYPLARRVLERDRPDGALEVGRLALRPGDQLEDPVPLRPVGQRAALALDEPPHVGGHRGQVERCTDQGVIQVEYAQTHALTVS